MSRFEAESYTNACWQLRGRYEDMYGQAFRTDLLFDIFDAIQDFLNFDVLCNQKLAQRDRNAMDTLNVTFRKVCFTCISWRRAIAIMDWGKRAAVFFSSITCSPNWLRWKKNQFLQTVGLILYPVTLHSKTSYRQMWPAGVEVYDIGS